MTSHPFYFFPYIDFVEASHRYVYIKLNSYIIKIVKKNFMCIKTLYFSIYDRSFLSYCFSMASDYNYNNPKKKKLFV